MAPVVSPRRGHSTSGPVRRRLVGAAALTSLALALGACGGLASGGDAPAAGGSDKPAAVGLASLDIIVPADPGGGWDQTGRALQKELQGTGLAKTVNVTNVGGAGGTNGLASLANVTDPDTLMVTGLVMVGAVETNKSQARIEDTTPIARLTEEPLVIVVPAGSKYQTLEELVDDIVANGKSVTVTGGRPAARTTSSRGCSSSRPGSRPRRSSTRSTTSRTRVAASPSRRCSATRSAQASRAWASTSSRSTRARSARSRSRAPRRSRRSPTSPPSTTRATGSTSPTGAACSHPPTSPTRSGLRSRRSSPSLHASDEWQATLTEKGWADAFLTGADFDDYLQQNIVDIQTVLQDIGLVS